MPSTLLSQSLLLPYPLNPRSHALAAGVGSDPQKLARFRALMRVRSSLPEAALQTPALKNFSRMLMKVTQASSVMRH